MSTAESIVPISSSDGWAVADRMRNMVMIGHARHSMPRKRVDQAQIVRMVRPRHKRKHPAIAKIISPPTPANASQASHAPVATTRLPSAALMRSVHDGAMSPLMFLVSGVSARGGQMCVGDAYTVRLTKNAAAWARREIWSF